MTSHHESGLDRRRILECTLLVAIAVAPRLSATSDARARENAFAQYCIPEDDVPVTQTIYCRA
jgi:hypothetical protein